jgi:hypothetical protein
MSGTLSIKEAVARATKRRQMFRRVLACDLVLRFAIGSVALVAPTLFSQLLNLLAVEPDVWTHAWGAMQIVAVVLLLPGYWNPIVNRWPNVVGIMGRALTAALYCSAGGGFLWLALFDGTFALLLVVSYRSHFFAELMSRP